MVSTYDLSVPADMLAFDTDCRNAAGRSPHNPGRSKISKDEPFSIAEFFLKWYHDETLWEYGWSKYLSATARATFDRYAIVRRRHLLDLETKRMCLAGETVRWRVENKLERC
jgi:hypothetical protein